MQPTIHFQFIMTREIPKLKNLEHRSVDVATLLNFFNFLILLYILFNFLLSKYPFFHGVVLKFSNTHVLMWQNSYSPDKINVTLSFQMSIVGNFSYLYLFTFLK
jgi:hypothetical protein